MSRSHLCAQSRIRSAQAPACIQPVGGPARDLLEHQQLGAVQVADDRDVRRDARRRLVDRGEVVQVQRVGIRCAYRGQSARPCRHLMFALRVRFPRARHTVATAASLMRLQRSSGYRPW